MRDERLGRCCDRHDDWTTLRRHLLADFPRLARAEVLEELTNARGAVSMMAVEEPEALYLAELIARNQLLLRAGEVVDTARLAPQRPRGRRAREAEPGPAYPPQAQASPARAEGSGGC